MVQMQVNQLKEALQAKGNESMVDSSRLEEVSLLSQNLEASLLEKSEANAALEQKVTELEQSMSEMTEKSEKQAQAQKNLQESYDSLLSGQGDQADLIKERDRLKKKCDNLTEKAKKFIVKIKQLDAKAEEQDKTEAELKMQVTELQGKVSELESQLQESTCRDEGAEAKTAELRSQLDINTNEVREKTEALAGLTERWQSSRNQPANYLKRKRSKS